MHERHSVCHRVFLFRVFFVGSFMNLGVTFFLGIITNKGHWNRFRSFMLLSSNQLNEGSRPPRLTHHVYPSLLSPQAQQLT